MTEMSTDDGFKEGTECDCVTFVISKQRKDKSKLN